MSVAAIGKFLNNISDLPASQQGTVKAIQQASARMGVDFAYLVQKANIESSLNPQAKAKTSSASGSYQFTESTWLDMIDRHGKEYGFAGLASSIKRDTGGKLYVADKAARQEILNLRNSPQVSAVMAAELAAENAEALEAKVGGKIGATEMYMAHFLGAKGASTFLNTLKANPNAAAARLLPDAAAANHNVFYTNGGRARTVGEVYANFAAKFKDTNVASAPAKEVAAVAAPSVPAIKPAPVQQAEPKVIEAKAVQAVAAKHKLQLLATITNDNISVASDDGIDLYDAPPAVQVAMADNAGPASALFSDFNFGLGSLLDSGTQFNAMMTAQQMLDTTGRSRTHDERRANA